MGLDPFPALSGQKASLLSVTVICGTPVLSKLPVMIREGTRLSKEKIPTVDAHVPASSTLYAPPSSEIDTEQFGTSEVCHGYNVTLLTTTAVLLFNHVGLRHFRYLFIKNKSLLPAQTLHRSILTVRSYRKATKRMREPSSQRPPMCPTALCWEATPQTCGAR